MPLPLWVPILFGGGSGGAETPLTPDAGFVVEVDWDGDGLLLDDISGDIRAARGFTTRRGLDVARIITPPQTGKLTGVLDNRGSDYGPHSAFVRGIPIRVRETGAYDGTTRAIWRGILEEPKSLRTQVDAVTAFSALGGMSRFSGRSISTALYESIRTDEALDVLLDAVGWPKNYSRYVLGYPLIASFRLDEESGDAIDYSGNGNDAAPNGTPQYRETALIDEGASVRLNGIDEWFDAGAPAEYDVTNDFTLSFWMRVSGSPSGFYDPLSYGHDGSTGWVIQGNGASMDAVFQGAGSATFGDLRDAAVHHCVVTKSSTDGIRTYVDSEEVTHNASATAAIVLYASRSLNIGRDPGTGRHFPGWIQQVDWIDGVLSAAEVGQLYALGLDAPRHLDIGRTELLHWWLGDKDGPRDSWDAMLEILNTEGPGARAYEDGTGAFVFRNRHAISVDERAISPQFHIADDGQPSHSDIEYLDNRASIVNYAEITVTRREEQALGVVWEFGETLTLSPDEARVLYAVSEDAAPNKSAVAPTTGGGDYVVASGSVVSVTLDRDSGGVIPVRITAGPSGATITGFRLRAVHVPVVGTNIAVSRSVNPALLDSVKAWDRPIRSDIDFTFAEALADAIPGWYGLGIPYVTLVLKGDNIEKIGAQLQMEIGDMISVTDAPNELDEERFIVASIEHHYSGALLTTTIVAEYLVGGLFGVWDVGVWDVSRWGL